MTNAFDAEKHWEQVETELRARRTAQRQAWGDLDDAVLGRYLADEVDGTERRQVETALQERPELRRLTDLVRDVLAEFEPSAAAPTTLPFPVSTAQPTRRSSNLRRHAGLVAAAAVLLGLGLGLDLSGVRTPHAAVPVAIRTPQPQDERAERRRMEAEEETLRQQTTLPLQELAKAVQQVRIPEKQPDALVRLDTDQTEFTGEQVSSLAVNELSLHLLNQSNRNSPTQMVQARQLVDARVELLNQAGKNYQAQGNTERAGCSYGAANYLVARAELKDDHPLTVETRQNLAEFYLDALTPEVDNGARGKAADRYPAAIVSPAVATGHDAVRNDNLSRFMVQVLPYLEPEGKRERLGAGNEVQRKRIVSNAVEAVPALCYALHHPKQTEQRVRAARALGVLGPEARAAVPELEQRLRLSRDPHECVVILDSLDRIGANVAWPAVVTVLANEDGHVRRAAAETLTFRRSHDANVHDAGGAARLGAGAAGAFLFKDR